MPARRSSGSSSTARATRRRSNGKTAAATWATWPTPMRPRVPAAWCSRRPRHAGGRCRPEDRRRDHGSWPATRSPTRPTSCSPEAYQRPARMWRSWPRRDGKRQTLTAVLGQPPLAVVKPEGDGSAFVSADAETARRPEDCHQGGRVAGPDDAHRQLEAAAGKKKTNWRFSCRAARAGAGDPQAFSPGRSAGQGAARRELSRLSPGTFGRDSQRRQGRRTPWPIGSMARPACRPKARGMLQDQPRVVGFGRACATWSWVSATGAQQAPSTLGELPHDRRQAAETWERRAAAVHWRRLAVFLVGADPGNDDRRPQRTCNSFASEMPIRVGPVPARQGR